MHNPHILGVTLGSSHMSQQSPQEPRDEADQSICRTT